MTMDHGGAVKHIPALIKSFRFRLDTELDLVEGEVAWDSDAGTVAIGYPGGNIVLQVGQELLVRCTNKTGVTIPNGTPVYVNGAQGSRPTIAPTKADNAMTALTFAGVTTEEILNNRSGYVCNAGIVHDLDTSDFDEGDIVYLSADDAGLFTKTPPPAPNYIVGAGIVLVSNNEVGAILIRTKVYPNLNRLADVSISSPTNGQILRCYSIDGVTYFQNFDPIFGNYEEGNYSEFESDGTLVAHGNATCWDDIALAATALGVGATAPDLVNINGSGIYLRAFDGLATTEQLFGSFEIPHDYAEGTDLIPHIHWMPTTAGAGTVRFYVDYWRVDGPSTYAPSTPTTIYAEGTTNSTAWEAFRTDTNTISGTGITIGDQVAFRLYRDPSQDTYGADAAVLTFGIHYQINSLGSRQITIK